MPAVVMVVIDHHTASSKLRMLASGSGRSVSRIASEAH
jgi:hypothetical protein